MKYLHDIFNFNPVVINIDYSLSLNNALINNKIFDKQPIILNCFFYYTQAIVRKMKKLNLFKNQKKSINIAQNIEIMSFIKPSLIPKYMNHLREILNQTNKEKLLLDYLDKYWINYRGIKSFNFYEYIKSEKANNSIKYLFITNNIAESFHG